MTIMATTTALSLPSSDVKTFHNYQVVLPTQLPIKRLYNPLKEQLIQLIKLPNDFNFKRRITMPTTPIMKYLSRLRCVASITCLISNHLL